MEKPKFNSFADKWYGRIFLISIPVLLFLYGLFFLEGYFHLLSLIVYVLSFSSNLILLYKHDKKNSEIKQKYAEYLHYARSDYGSKRLFEEFYNENVS